MNLKRGRIGDQEPVLLAMLGEVRFRSHLHFCKAAPSVSRARLGAQSRQDGLGIEGGTVVQADAGVRPYGAGELDRLVWCHTRVQGLGAGGKVSNSVRLNLKSRETAPYRTVPASTWVPGQIPRSLDSARYEIGQLSSGMGG